jgi:hypothetical protein
MKILYDRFHENVDVMWKGVVGTSASMVGTSISFIPQLETTLRLLSLVVGILVGLVTIWSILKHKRK